MYWLLKSEPTVFSIDHLSNCPQQTEPWDGIRNYQARNMMCDQMRCGDQGFFYHSNTAMPGIVGICQVVREAYPDVTAFDPQSKYYDAESNPENPRWYRVDIQLVRRLERIITLRELKNHGGEQVKPVTQEQWAFILGLE
jgi:predicted RNA-binding protein with PUA-like domain